MPVLPEYFSTTGEFYEPQFLREEMDEARVISLISTKREEEQTSSLFEGYAENNVQKFISRLTDKICPI